jgi:hypothetical protein
MERQLKRGALLAVIALFAMGCSARPISGSAGGVEPPRIVPAVLVPVDENGNLRGSAGPWVFLFDLDDERIRPSDAEVASTAEEIATYMKENPSLRLRIDAKGAPIGTDAQTLAVRQHRIAAIRDALVNAGVPADRISLGVAPTPYRPFRW